ncbi:hypothetical protein FOCC_FOCC013467, partial [Frankliniella occidentalis]
MKWEPEPWSEGIKGVKGVKGRRPGASANVPAYGGYLDQWGGDVADMQWGLKTSPRRPPAGVKGIKGVTDDTQQHVKGQGRSRRPGGYQFGGWGHQDYQSCGIVSIYPYRVQL